MKKFFLGALAIAGLVACVQEDVLNTPDLRNEIGFGGYVNGSVRSVANPSTTTNTIEHFTVWSYMDDKAGLILENELVEKSGDVWTYANTQYWLAEHQYHFYAITPYGNGKDSHVTIANGANYDCYADYLGTIEFENVDGTEDVLYATADESTVGNSIPESVQFAFDHLLSKVKFTFVNGFTTSNIDIAVTEVTMTAPKNATTTLGKQVHSGYEWTGHTGETVLDFGNIAAGDRIHSLSSGASDNERLTFPAKVDDNLTYTVKFKVAQYVGTQTTPAATYDLESTVTGVEFVAGKAYNFVAEITNETLDLKKIEFKVTVDEWDPANGEAVDVPVGYYYNAETNTYSVATANGLQDVAAIINAGNLTANVVLKNDIDLSTATRSAANWTPIGLSSNLSGGLTFTGSFDGNNHTISNLVCEGTDVAGLFGYMYSGSIKNVTLDNATIRGNHFAGLVAWVNNLSGNTKKPFVLENCHVINSTISSTPEQVNGAWDNGDKVGGLIGAAWISRSGAINAGTKIANCSVENTTVSAYRDLGGLFGLAEGVKTENCVLENVTVKQDLTNGYKDETPTTVGSIIGRDAGGNVINGYEYVSTAATLAAALTSENENISVVLANDIEAPISSLGQTASGDAKQMGGVDTKTITIDLAGHKLNLTTTYWSVLGAKNSDALVTIKNGTITSSQTSGTWDSYDLGFVNCNYAFENVVFEKAIALGAANKNYTLKNVTINETHDYYAMWVEAVGQNITIDGLTVNSAGRGIKIDEQYVGTPKKVTLNISNSTFETAKKAAILVMSEAGAEINAENLNIAKVAADNTFAVWVDEDAAAHADKVVVNGALCTVEGQGAVAKDASGLSEAIASGATTIALADGSYSMPGVGGKSVTIVGSKDVVITVSKPNMGGGNVTFDGVTVKGSGYATGVQHVNSVTYNNVTVIGEMCLYGESVVFNNCTFELPSGKYIWTYGCKNSAFNNCVFNTAGKAILVYNEGGTDCHVVVEGCVFNATEGAKAGAIANQNCAAIEIDNYTGRAHNVTTSANVWGDNFSGEWRIKSYAAGNPITVNGVEYTSIAIDGKTMTIDANKNVTVNE